MSETIWTQNPTLEPKLRELVAKGVTAGSISRVLKVSRNQVIGKATRLGLRLAGSTPRLREAGAARRGKTRTAAPKLDVSAFSAPSPPRRFSWQDPPA